MLRLCDQLCTKFHLRALRMNGFFGIPVFIRAPPNAQQQMGRVRYVLLQRFNPNIGNRTRFANPIVVSDDDDDDDDVVEIGRGHTRNDPNALGPAPMTTLDVCGFSVRVPVVRESVIGALREAQRLEPTMQLDRVATFLETVIRTDGEISNLVDRIIIAGKDANTQVVRLGAEEECVDFIKNCFPDVFMKDIKEKLMRCNYSLKRAIEEISADKTVKRVKSPRAKLKCITINDILVTIQIMEMHKEEEEERKTLLKQLRYETEKRKGNLVECQCCFDAFLDEDVASCPRGHRFCKNCLSTNVVTFMGEGRTEIRCLSSVEECDQNVPIEQLVRFVDKKIIQNLFRIEAENAVIKANVKNTIKCWKCGYIAQYSGNCDFECPECRFKTCKKCGEASHLGISCDEIKNIDKNRFIEEQMNEAVIRVCPKCKAKFMKEEGCNKMECPRCKTWICYWCRKEIPPDIGYQHFWRDKGICPPDKCPLWVENDMLHHLEAIQAVKENK